MYHELYKKISESVGLLTVFLDGEKISQGSCFCFLDTGEVITAAHVITGRNPIKQEDVQDPSVQYFIKFPNVPLLEYTVSFCAITVHVDSFKEPIQIDMAVLQPKRNYEVEYPVLPINVNPPRLGDQVFLAGYSDELKLPFLIDRIIYKDHQGVDDFLQAMAKGYAADMTGPMIKRAYVGNHVVAGANNSHENFSLTCDILYLDNGMHSGASGGPVVNESGVAVGIITQRAITSASQYDAPSLDVPSGSTIAISFQSLLALNTFPTQNNS